MKKPTIIILTLLFFYFLYSLNDDFTPKMEIYAEYCFYITIIIILVNICFYVWIFLKRSSLWNYRFYLAILLFISIFRFEVLFQAPFSQYTEFFCEKIKIPLIITDL